jgi:hypothetical protein
VGLLEVVPADLRGRDLRGDREDRNSAAVRIEQAVDQMQVSRSAAAGAHRQLTGQPGLAGGGEHGDGTVGEDLPARAARPYLDLQPAPSATRTREFEIFCNEHRPHQGVANTRPLAPLPVPITDPYRLAHLNIHRRDRLAGVLREYPTCRLTRADVGLAKLPSIHCEADSQTLQMQSSVI